MEQLKTEMKGELKEVKEMVSKVQVRIDEQMNEIKALLNAKI